MYPNSADLPSGTFSASGPAVEAGLLCQAGTVQDLEHRYGGPPDGQVLAFSVLKRFTCNDGSGTFELRLNGLVTSNSCTAHWIIASGDGPYSGLLGNGGFSCLWLSSDLVQDTYSGQLHTE